LCSCPIFRVLHRTGCSERQPPTFAPTSFRLPVLLLTVCQLRISSSMLLPVQSKKATFLHASVWSLCFFAVEFRHSYLLFPSLLGDCEHIFSYQRVPAPAVGVLAMTIVSRTCDIRVFDSRPSRRTPSHCLTLLKLAST
jgi:hypothetical protein